MALHKFIGVHLNYIYGISKVAIANLKNENKSEEKNEDEPRSSVYETSLPNFTKIEILDQRSENESFHDDSEATPNDFSFMEDWRGLSSTPKTRRESKYLTPCKEIEACQAANILKPAKQRVLINGNHTGFIKVGNKKHIQIKNTCAFDSLCQAIAEGFIQNEKYRDHINNSNNSTLITAKSLGTIGAVHETYKERCTALIPFSKLELDLPTKGKLDGTVYNSWSHRFKLK